MNDDMITPLGMFQDYSNQKLYNDTNTFSSISTVSFEDLNKIRQEILIHKLQTLRLLKLIEDSQYKSLLGMLASPDERDKDMARDSIRTLFDDNL